MTERVKENIRLDGHELGRVKSIPCDGDQAVLPAVVERDGADDG